MGHLFWKKVSVRMKRCTGYYSDKFCPKTVKGEWNESHRLSGSDTVNTENRMIKIRHLRKDDRELTEGDRFIQRKFGSSINHVTENFIYIKQMITFYCTGQNIHVW